MPQRNQSPIQTSFKFGSNKFKSNPKSLFSFQPSRPPFLPRPWPLAGPPPCPGWPTFSLLCWGTSSLSAHTTSLVLPPRFGPSGPPDPPHASSSSIQSKAKLPPPPPHPGRHCLVLPITPREASHLRHLSSCPPQTGDLPAPLPKMATLKTMKAPPTRWSIPSPDPHLPPFLQPIKDVRPSSSLPAPQHPLLFPSSAFEHPLIGVELD
jgi:hypothetical protein